MSAPLLSVIIPVYNAELHIEKCLKSVLEQTLTDIEIILINDCSTDNTLQIIQNFKDKRIVLINNEKNLGTGASRNKGLLFARGKYVGFADNDDWTDKNYFEEMVNSIKENDICVTLKITNHNKFSIPHYILPNDLREIVFIKRTPPWAKIYKKEFLIKNNIKFDLTRGEDIYPAFLCAILTDKIAFTNKTNYNCNIRKNSVSHKKINESDLDEIKLYSKLLEYSKKLSDEKYWFKLIKKRGLISFDFLYKKADKNLKSKIISEYKTVFNSKYPLFEYGIWKIQNFFEKMGSFFCSIFAKNA